jgi:hypothetical protein
MSYNMRMNTPFRDGSGYTHLLKARDLLHGAWQQCVVCLVRVVQEYDQASHNNLELMFSGDSPQRVPKSVARSTHCTNVDTMLKLASMCILHVIFDEKKK